MPFSPQPVWSFVPTTRSLGRIVGLILVYFVICKLGLRLATIHPSATAVWPGTGIALGAILVLGYEVWLGVFFGALLFGGLINGTSGRHLSANVFPPQLAGNLTLIIQGLIILFIAADVLVLYVWQQRKRLKTGRRPEGAAGAAA